MSTKVLIPAYNENQMEKGLSYLSKLHPGIKYQTPEQYIKQSVQGKNQVRKAIKRYINKMGNSLGEQPKQVLSVLLDNHSFLEKVAIADDLSYTNFAILIRTDLAVYISSTVELKIQYGFTLREEEEDLGIFDFINKALTNGEMLFLSLSENSWKDIRTEKSFDYSLDYSKESWCAL